MNVFINPGGSTIFQVEQSWRLTAPRTKCQGLQLAERVENPASLTKKRGRRHKSETSSGEVETRLLGRDENTESAVE